MSSKRMPGDGQSGNCLRPDFSSLLRWVSSVELEASEADFPPWATCCDVELMVGSGADVDGCEEVLSRGLVVEAEPCGTMLMLRKREEEQEGQRKREGKARDGVCACVCVGGGNVDRILQGCTDVHGRRLL